MAYRTMTSEYSRSEALVEFDLKHIWHPCTQMKDHESLPPIAIKSGQGVWLEDYQGKRYLDAISSWWVNLFGHCNLHISTAIQKQLNILEHVLLAGFTHEPIVQLAKALLPILPSELTRLSFADSGSNAVEIALKMSFQYWHNLEKPQKQYFVHLENSYHGESIGALSVGGIDLYSALYKPLFFKSYTVKSPDCFLREPGESWRDCSLRQFKDMEQTLLEHADTIAAVIVEPLVQCAGNMRMYHPAYLSALRTLCDKLNIHLIADEIAVGFGRTGTMFACEQANITPDFLCFGKGLTGGYLPLASVATNEKIYQAFYADYQTGKGFLHSHSYTGNPLACAAAVATLKLFEQKPVIEQNRKLAEKLLHAVADITDHPHVAEVRQSGMIIAIELVKNKQGPIFYPAALRINRAIYQRALEAGLLLRPLGNVIYFMPPYVITDEEIIKLGNQTKSIIHQITRQFDS